MTRHVGPDGYDEQWDGHDHSAPWCCGTLPPGTCPLCAHKPTYAEYMTTDPPTDRDEPQP